MADAGGMKEFMATFGRQVDGPKLNKAKKMLQADRFQLFVDVDDQAMTGVVKSQTDASLVYACRITREGDFACCTQNLNQCGGLRGKLCKHILVVMVGLVQGGQLPADQALAWAKASRARAPNIARDRDAMAETFLRYKGAEAGEIDWRPTETLPEDYYAL
jgi:hypothetical protein